MKFEGVTTTPGISIVHEELKNVSYQRKGGLFGFLWGDPRIAIGNLISYKSRPTKFIETGETSYGFDEGGRLLFYQNVLKYPEISGSQILTQGNRKFWKKPLLNLSRVSSNSQIILQHIWIDDFEELYHNIQLWNAISSAILKGASSIMKLTGAVTEAMIIEAVDDVKKELVSVIMRQQKKHAIIGIVPFYLYRNNSNFNMLKFTSEKTPACWHNWGVGAFGMYNEINLRSINNNGAETLDDKNRWVKRVKVSNTISVILGDVY